MDPLEDRFVGCLLGCAVGDAVGLPYEGLRPRRLSKWLRLPLRHRFVFGRGMVSDDTDHTIFVAQALARHPECPREFARCLGWKFRLWLLCLPAGIGLATLRSILRLWFGVPASRSGVYSAGNGAAMRSAVIGVFHAEDSKRRREFVSASTRITHSDPKANYGALAVAEIAAHETRSHSSVRPSLDALREILESVSPEDHWRDVVDQTMNACASGRVADAVPPESAHSGVSGYVYQTVPAAIAAWHIHHGDVRATVEAVIALGGDTDTVGAIAGALAGISTGRSGVPEDWVDGIVDWPHSPAYLLLLGRALACGEGAQGLSPWLFPRGAVFTLVVLAHGFRRLLPPF